MKHVEISAELFSEDGKANDTDLTDLRLAVNEGGSEKHGADPASSRRNEASPALNPRAICVWPHRNTALTRASNFFWLKGLAT